MLVKHFVEASSYQLHVQLHEFSISSIANQKVCNCSNQMLATVTAYIYIAVIPGNVRYTLYNMYTSIPGNPTRGLLVLSTYF